MLIRSSMLRYSALAGRVLAAVASACTISFGVPSGATRPSHDSLVAPGKPAFAPSYARWELKHGNKAETVFVVPRIIGREGVHMHEA